jgi:hypothetical protein
MPTDSGIVIRLIKQICFDRHVEQVGQELGFLLSRTLPPGLQDRAACPGSPLPEARRDLL